jgi:hypothetical protein
MSIATISFHVATTRVPLLNAQSVTHPVGGLRSPGLEVDDVLSGTRFTNLVYGLDTIARPVAFFVFVAGTFASAFNAARKIKCSTASIVAVGEGAPLEAQAQGVARCDCRKRCAWLDRRRRMERVQGWAAAKVEPLKPLRWVLRR